jgi:hypothetical protein
MRLRTNFTLAVGLLTTLLWSAIVHAEPGIYPTGVTRYDPAKAYNIFILFSGGDQKTHLIDMDGSEVHVWDHFGSQRGLLTRLLLAASGVK